MTTTDKLTAQKAEKLDEHFAADVRKGLSESPKRIPSKYFYDEKGSRLFEEIMKLEEYYPTACEREIFETYKEEFRQIAGDKPFQLIDLGAGDAEKTGILLQYFYQHKVPFTYVPIDISGDILKVLQDRLEDKLPGLQVQAIAAEYFDALNWLHDNNDTRKMVFFMGGNIGNFTKSEALAFVRRMGDKLNAGDLLLIGFDLKKDPRVIRTAYDDGKGVTAAFNFNLLERMNRELGANFDLSLWKHYASYDPVTGAVQSYLISQQAQDVHISETGQDVHFNKYEPIHTEYSMKFSPEEIDLMAEQAGFIPVAHFTCKKEYFMDTIWTKAEHQS